MDAHDSESFRPRRFRNAVVKLTSWTVLALIALAILFTFSVQMCTPQVSGILKPWNIPEIHAALQSGEEESVAEGLQAAAHISRELQPQTANLCVAAIIALEDPAHETTIQFRLLTVRRPDLFYEVTRDVVSRLTPAFLNDLRADPDRQDRVERIIHMADRDRAILSLLRKRLAEEPAQQSSDSADAP